MTGRRIVHITGRATARGLAVLTAVVVLLVSGVAAAAPAPMCDEHAQSIAAPFPIFPSHFGEASTSRPCLGKNRFELGHAPTPERDPPGSVAAHGVDRAPPAAHFQVVRDRGRVLAPRAPERALPRHGFSSDVFRPPRSR
ncbi:MAG: hypothetical protein IT377_34030 [Polyangiaceae bacterium]|nr:hypothetical protein [Polyangiaceae bacterium]